MNTVRTWLGRMTLLAASLAGGLVVAEQGARALHRDAFPFLNLFTASAEYGVVLRPDECASLRSRTGRTSRVCTNTHGFRGPEWDTLPTHGRVMVLGDSQVLGYGVEASDTAWAKLTPVSGGRFNAVPLAVPTWGPPEFARAAAQWVPVLQPDHVVMVAYVGNDWNEAPVANHRRTTARDGWPHRVVATEAPPASFPFREYLMGRSHLVQALRTLGHASVAAPNRAAGLQQLIAEVEQLARPMGAYASRISPHLARIVDTCRIHRCRVHLAVLPVDVMADATAWSKYGAPARDTSMLTRLGDAALADASALGAGTVDLLPTLRAASPGAWLNDDDHLSPAGHLAVAGALARVLRDDVAQVSP